MFHFVLFRNKKSFTSLYAILISMFSNNILALNQIGLGNEILDPEDAFKVQITDIDNSFLLNWKIEKTYYIYQNSIKVLYKNNPIKFKVIGDPIMHKDEFLGETTIFRDTLNLELLEKKELNLMDYEVIFQGCAEKRFCYTPIKVKLSSLEVLQ